MAAAACRTTSASPTPTRMRARCASPTAPTRCTATRLPSSNWASRRPSPRHLPSAATADALVLGAGIVGISVALHLQKRGRATLLIDRRGAAEETSFGNAGLVQREGVYPYGFPHDFGALFRYGLNRTIDAHYHPSAIPALAAFLWRYWHHSRPRRAGAGARLPRPLRATRRALRPGQRRGAGNGSDRLAAAHGRWASGGTRCGRRARTVVRRCDAAPGLRPAARGEARLSHALPRRRPRGAEPPDSRRRARLFPRADAARHPAHDRRRVRAARCDPHAGAARARRADRAQSLPARRTPRYRAVDGLTPVHAGHDAGDRPGAAP